MFYLSQRLKTELRFTPYDMDKLHSDDEVIKRLKEKIQGRCHPQYGYILQIVSSRNSNSRADFEIDVPRVEDGSISVTVTFSAITFKVLKNDIIDIIVTEICEDSIRGRVGQAEVLIPKTKLPKEGYEYRINENIFILHNQNGEEFRIEKDSRVRCKCFEVRTQMNYQMSIIAVIDEKIMNNFSIS